jgi:hypothetical protein
LLGEKLHQSKRLPEDFQWLSRAPTSAHFWFFFGGAVRVIFVKGVSVRFYLNRKKRTKNKKKGEGAHSTKRTAGQSHSWGGFLVACIEARVATSRTLKKLYGRKSASIHHP